MTGGCFFVTIGKWKKSKPLKFIKYALVGRKADSFFTLAAVQVVSGFVMETAEPNNYFLPRVIQFLVNKTPRHVISFMGGYPVSKFLSVFISSISLIYTCNCCCLQYYICCRLLLKNRMRFSGLFIMIEAIV